MSLGKNICNLRKEKNITQEELAFKLDVTRQTISNWELDESTPNSNQLKKLSKELDVSIDKLIDNEEFKNNLIQSCNERKNILKIMFIMIAFIWTIASIISFMQSDIMMGIIDLILSFIWIILFILLEKKLKK